MKWLRCYALLLCTLPALGSSSSAGFSLSSLGNLSLSAVKKKVKKMAQLALNYAILNKTLSYKELDDFTGEGESFQSFTLSPGSALKIHCGSSSKMKTGLVSLHPREYLTHSLAPMSKSGIVESLTRVIRHFDLFRSDETIVHFTSELFGGSVIVQHPYSTVIAAKNPEFTLNFACVYDPNFTEEGEAAATSTEASGPDAGGAGEPDPSGAAGPNPSAERPRDNLLYRWIEVKFTGVMPLAYGCGSGKYPLFNNLSASRNPLDKDGPALPTSRSCEITPEPGMVVGMYCENDERFDDSLCFQDSALKTYYDPQFEFTNAPGRLHLFRVPESGFQGDVSFLCLCRDRRGEVTAELRVSRVSVFVCDFTRVFEGRRPDEKLSMQSCKHDLKPGESLRLVAPLNQTALFYFGVKYLSVLEPEDIRSKTYIQSIHSDEVTLAALEDVLVSRGFSVTKVEARDRAEYLFTYRKDAMLVLKSEIASLSYYWTMMERRVPERRVVEIRSKNERVFGVVNVGLVPTDPYTLGCGVRNEFFRPEFVEFKTGSENGRVVSRCTVDASKGPVGFYCPAPFVLEPRDCFRSVIAVRSRDGEAVEEVAELERVLKNGRAHRSAHLAILEVYRGAHEFGPGEEGLQGLVCKCLDAEGNTVASIQVLNPNLAPFVPSPEAEGDGALGEGEAPGEEGVGEIRTRVN